jgi:hypothetical protein
MGPEASSSTSRRLLVLCLLAWTVLFLWAWQKPVHPNSDRYDYAARATSLRDGDGLRPQLDYPLRLALSEISEIPAPNRTRTPVWPLLLVPGIQGGLAAKSGVLMAALFALAVAALLWRVGDASFGPPTGAFAVAFWLCSFATARAIHGGGPEIALAFLTLACWSWTPALHGAWGYLACGSLYGLMPLLHPLGFLFAALAFLARSHRYSGRGRLLVLAGALAIAMPWHLWMLAQGGLLQSHAELAKSLFDAGGLGPYRGLDAAPNHAIALEHFPRLLHVILARLKERALHLDALLPWAAVLVGLSGMRMDRPLALRDLGVGLMGGAILCAFSWEARLWLPLLPVAAIWAGVGARALPSQILPWGVVALCAASWFVPLGLSPSPRADLREAASSWVSPSDAAAAVLSTAGIDGSPIVCDSAALAWRSGRRGIVLPYDPRTLRRIRRSDAGSQMSVLALGQGRASWWLTGAAASWDSLLSHSRVLFEEEGGAAIFELVDVAEESRADGKIPSMSVDKHHTLPPEYAPEELVELPSPPASRAGIQITAATWAALAELLAAAHLDGLDLRVISGYRSHEYQKQLFANAVANHGDDQAWVAEPGQSEHQLGTTVDLADGAMEHVLEQSFGETIEGQWLRDNCGRFGFRLSYTTANEDETGIRSEPWHLRLWGER